jgi:hypothetical protein
MAKIQGFKGFQSSNLEKFLRILEFIRFYPKFYI